MQHKITTGDYPVVVTLTLETKEELVELQEFTDHSNHMSFEIFKELTGICKARGLVVKG